MAGQTVRDVVRDLMRDWKMTTVFGNPGTTEVPFLAGWPDDFRYVLGLQESAVLAMADAYAQFSRNATVVSLHSAGGLGHALGSMVTAFHNRAPLIAISGQQARSLLPGEPYLGALDATEFPKPYVKWAAQPARAEDVPAAFARAYQLATQPPSGPVFLSIPSDDWDQPADALPAKPRVGGFAPDDDALAEVAAALDASGNPAIVVGAVVDTDDAVPDVVRLAEKALTAVWEAPFSARSSFPEDHSLFAGFLQPNARAVAEALSRHDLVVVIGAPAFTYHVPTRGEIPELPPLYLISDEAQVLARAPRASTVLSTPRAAIRTLTGLVTESPSRSAPPPRVPAKRPPEPSPGEAMSGAYVYRTLAEVMPADALVVEEAPTHRGDIQEQLPITARGRGFLTMASGVLGYGLPAAVGAALAAPGRPVVAVLGDGSSMYGIQALWTAARQRTPVVFVVLDNAEYAAVRRNAASTGAGKVPGTELGGLDFSALARGMGCDAAYVETPGQLKESLHSAFNSPVPTLLHVRVLPWGS